MCAKLNQVIARFIPEGTVKEALKSSYYNFYYNQKHFKENRFRVYYKNGVFEFKFDEGVAFKCYENISDELKRSLKGYLAKHALKEGETVIDCGAYVGEFTLYAAKAVGTSGRVIAFEPDPAVFIELTANVGLNGLENVILINKGLWNSDDVLKFVGDDVRGYSFLLADTSGGAIDVPVAGLDNELERLGIKRVDFIKVDVEGAELELIRGAGNILKNNKVDLAIASYHPIDGKKSCFELERMLPLIGYAVETSHTQHLTTYAKKMR